MTSELEKWEHFHQLYDRFKQGRSPKTNEANGWQRILARHAAGVVFSVVDWYLENGSGLPTFDEFDNRCKSEGSGKAGSGSLSGTRFFWWCNLTGDYGGDPKVTENWSAEKREDVGDYLVKCTPREFTDQHKELLGVFGRALKTEA